MPINISTDAQMTVAMAQQPFAEHQLQGLGQGPPAHRTGIAEPGPPSLMLPVDTPPVYPASLVNTIHTAPGLAGPAAGLARVQASPGSCSALGAIAAPSANEEELDRLRKALACWEEGCLSTGAPRWIIGSLVGHGASGVVYKARDMRGKRNVAIKAVASGCASTMHP